MTSCPSWLWGPSHILVATLDHLDDAGIEIGAIIEDMLGTLLTAALLAAAPATAFRAFVQSTPNATQGGVTPDQRVDRWGLVVDQVSQLEEPELSLALLSGLKATTDKVRNQLDAVRAESEKADIGFSGKALPNQSSHRGDNLPTDRDGKP